MLARIASRFGFTAIPLYLIAGLAVGEGGVFPLDVSHDFIELVAEIGVLLLLLTLGLEYSTVELRLGLRSGGAAGVVDAVANFSPGFALGLMLGWEVPAAVLLGGVCWVSSSGIISKVLADLDRLGNRETPAILNLLVIEDLAMAAFLPIASTLVVGGLAQRLEVSAAIGAFLVGLALSGPVQRRAGALIGPLRDLRGGVLRLLLLPDRPARLVDSLVPAVLLAVVAIGTKIGTGWFAAAKNGV